MVLKITKVDVQEVRKGDMGLVRLCASGCGTEVPAAGIPREEWLSIESKNENSDKDFRSHILGTEITTRMH